MLFLIIFAANCRSALGLASGTIQDDQMTAYSAYNNDFTTFGSHRARLNLTSWPPGYRAQLSQASDSWIKIALKSKMVITGVATQGYGDTDVEEWTQQYVVMYSNGVDYLSFKDSKGQVKVSQMFENATFIEEFPSFLVNGVCIYKLLTDYLHLKLRWCSLLILVHKTTIYADTLITRYKENTNRFNVPVTVRSIEPLNSFIGYFVVSFIHFRAVVISGRIILVSGRTQNR